MNKFSDEEKAVVKEMIEELLVRNPEYRGVYEQVVEEQKHKLNVKNQLVEQAYSEGI
jgi:hypothetical protein